MCIRDRSYTIKDVAKLAHVSTATASLVINGKPGVRPETKARILAAVKQLNYTPNASARNLIRQRSDMLGLVVTELSNPFFGMLASEISKFAAQKGYHLSIGISNNKISQEAACVARFTQERAEGVIVTPSYMTDYDLQHLYQLKSAGIPLVFTSTRYMGIKADCVMCDIKKGEYLLTKHLLLTGHRRIYPVSYTHLAPTSIPRVGSSRMISLGFVASHLARITFCWFPPDRFLISCSHEGVLIASLSI